MGLIGRLRDLVTTPRGTLIVENTGDVTETDGGTAVSGYAGPPPKRGQKIVVKNTGSATATRRGSRSVSGIDYT